MKPVRVVEIIILILIFTSGLSSAETTIPLTLPDGKILQVEVVQTTAERARGLMFRPSLPEDSGMLFIFDQSREHPFWMKNTLFALDIIWMDHLKRITHIEVQVPPCRLDPCPTYGPRSESRYVLEVNGNLTRRWGLKIGNKLKF